MTFGGICVPNERGLIHVFPYNLVNDIFEHSVDLYSVYVPAICAEIEKLTEQENRIILMLYRDGMTYKEIAEELGITNDRVEQIRDKALSKLHHPARSKTFLMMSKAKHEQELSFYAEKLKVYEELYPFAKDIVDNKVRDDAGLFDKDKMPIEKLNLSDRTYVCLQRQGITTYGELSKLSKDDLLKIPNLGIKSTEEVIEKLTQFRNE